MSDFLPFSAVVGQDEAKLALLLTACDPRIGGVLLRGDKGSAKSTLARGLAALLPGRAPFIELPIGATEDRVVGTLDLTAALTGGEKRFEPGLLHAAHGGVLYVDEINLLPDHLVDVLLDVAASGVNRVEREGVSHSHPSRFVLIGSMNPEEGDLRPQLLDRFGLAVDVRTPASDGPRAEALRRRLEFDRDPEALDVAYAAPQARLADRLAVTRPASLDDALLDAVAALCAATGAEGLRADLTICRAAAALAGWEGRAAVEAADIRRVAPLALAHRSRRDPLDPPGHDQEQLNQAMDRHLGDTPEPEPPVDTGAESDEHVAQPGQAKAAPLPQTSRPLASEVGGRGAPGPRPRGRLVGDRAPTGPVRSVAVGATVRQAVGRRMATDQAGGGPLVEPGDIREAVRHHRSASLVVMAVDASGSMGAAQRMEAAKGTVLALLRDAYQRRDRVALVVFRGDDAHVLLKPTGSVEVARARLVELPTGGRTPLAAGLRTALSVAEKASGATGADYRPLLVVITDARATSAAAGRDPRGEAWAAAGEVRRAGVPSVVIDVEATGTAAPGLGLAAELAAAMGGSYVAVRELTTDAVEAAVRAASLR